MSYVPKQWVPGETITSDALNHIEQGIQDAAQSGGSGSDGATFTPSVSSDGVISWTNDKGLSNPDPVSIMGPEGPQGPKGDTGDTGPQGSPGPAGADGKSPYQIAVEGGWSGTENDFNAALANVGDIGALLDTINGEVV